MVFLTRWSFDISGVTLTFDHNSAMTLAVDPSVPTSLFSEVATAVHKWHANLAACHRIYERFKSAAEFHGAGLGRMSEGELFYIISPTNTAGTYLDLFGRSYASDDVKSDIELMFDQDVIDPPEDANPKNLFAAFEENHRRAARIRERYRLYQMAKEYPKEHRGYVYLMRLDETNRYKIGYSVDPWRRAREINSGLPIDIRIIHQIPSNQIACLENELHSRFQRLRFSKRNEWFALGEEDVEYITSLKEVNYEWINSSAWDEILSYRPNQFQRIPKPTS